MQTSPSTPSVWHNLTDKAVSLDNPGTFKSRKGLGVLHLNIRSLCPHQKLDHVNILISQADPDILILSETWLKNNVPDSVIAIKGYSIYRIDIAGGGVAIYVKNKYNVSVKKSVIVPKHFEFIALELDLGCKWSITVVGIYTPTSAIADSLHLLAELLFPL